MGYSRRQSEFQFQLLRRADTSSNKKSGCIKCPSKEPVCPACPQGMACQISVGTCDVCPTTVCEPNPNFKAPNETNIPLIVGISLAVIVVLGLVLAVIGRRRFRRHKQLFGDIIEPPKSPTAKKPRSPTDMYYKMSFPPTDSLYAGPARSSSNNSILFKDNQSDSHANSSQSNRPTSIQLGNPNISYRFGGSQPPPENINGMLSPRGSPVTSPPVSPALRHPHRPSATWVPHYYHSPVSPSSTPPTSDPSALMHPQSEVSHRPSYQPKPVLDLDIESLLAIQFYPTNHS